VVQLLLQIKLSSSGLDIITHPMWVILQVHCGLMYVTVVGENVNKIMFTSLKKLCSMLRIIRSSAWLNCTVTVGLVQ